MFRSDAKSAWNGLRLLTGMQKTSINVDIGNVNEFCNNLNIFYGRFDKENFSGVRTCMVNFHRDRLHEAERIIISENDVIKSLNSIKLGKAAGPDRINGNVLKLCKIPLASILCKIYQQSIDSVCIPTIWKTSEIIPVPKKQVPECNNDYRPIALTSIMMKCY